MIVVKDVSKVYRSKSGVEVTALKNVSVVFPEKGLVFILGKSGSGKSTMLNLLGGLDVPTSGQIEADGVSLGSLKQTDLDSYRNSYAGFVFQEFNLLEDMNVSENIALALTLSKADNVTEKISDALSRVELSEEYLTRKVNELSGGEKQRVAIARTVVKDSKLILADEPTGNLDSATSESIWKILKNLSATKLVVVVTHDRESAERYADRVIEISDGEVIKDSESLPAVTEQPHLSLSKARLPFKTRLKMAWKNLFKRKFRAVSAILLCVFSTLALVLVQMMLSYDPITFEADMVVENNIGYAVFRQNAKEGSKWYYECVRKSTQDFLGKNCSYTKGGIVSGKEQLHDLGLEFLNKDNVLELDDHSFYITKSALNYVFSDRFDSGSYVVVNGNQTPIKNFENDPESLIGRPVYISRYVNCDSGLPILAGIVDDSYNGKLVNTRLNEVFALSTFQHWATWLADPGHDDINVTVALGERSFNGGFYLGKECRYDMLVQGGMKSSDDPSVTVNDDEIIISFGLYSELFADANSMLYYVTEDKGNYSREEDQPLPEHLGETIQLKFFDSDGQLLYELGPRKLTGVALGGRYNEEYAIYIDGVNANTMDLYLGTGSDSVTVGFRSVKDIEKFIRQARAYDLEPYDMGDVPSRQPGADRSVVQISEELEEKLIIARWVLCILGGVLLVVMLLIVINIISFSVTARKREIGILTALGMSDKDTVGIFLLETLIVASFGFVGSLVLSIVLAKILNMFLFYYLLPLIHFLHL